MHKDLIWISLNETREQRLWHQSHVIVVVEKVKHFLSILQLWWRSRKRARRTKQQVFCSGIVLTFYYVFRFFELTLLTMITSPRGLERSSLVCVQLLLLLMWINSLEFLNEWMLYDENGANVWKFVQFLFRFPRRGLIVIWWRSRAKCVSNHVPSEKDLHMWLRWNSRTTKCLPNSAQY